MADGIKNGAGNEKWWDSTISGILGNEKYYGDVILQKTITVDFLNHKRVDNKGQVPQYFIEGNHMPIISKEIFDRVQDEKERRASLIGNLAGDRNRYTSKYPFSGKVFCGDCGNTFRRRTWNSNNVSKKTVWQCKTYIQEGKDACNAKAVDETVLMDAFVKMFNRLYGNRGALIKTLTDNIEKAIMKKASTKEIKALDKKIDKLKTELKGLVQFQVKNGMDDEVYKEEYIRITTDLEELRKRRAEFDKQDSIKEELRRRVNEIIHTINSRQELLEEFDKEIFNALVQRIEVISPTHFIFILKSGMRVEEIIVN